LIVVRQRKKMPHQFTMKRKTYAKLRLAALSILGAETVVFCALLLANSHASPFTFGNFHARSDLKSNGAEHSNLGERGYGNWVATTQDYANAANCVTGSGSCIEPESPTDFGHPQDYDLAISLADAAQSSHDTDGYQPGDDNNASTGGLASGRWLSEVVFGVPTAPPFGQLLSDPIGLPGSVSGDPGVNTEIITSTLDPPGNIGVGPNDPGPFIFSTDPINALSIAPASQVHSIPEPISLLIFGAGFIGTALLHRRKKKLA
jgi:hypothetical protein